MKPILILLAALLRNWGQELGSGKNSTAIRPVFEENGHEKPGSYACVRV